MYLAVIIDLFSRQVVGWSMQSHMKTDLVLDALRMAWFRRRPEAGLIFHSDRGSQFRSKKFVRTLKHNGLTGSMGRVGACGDNAAMESFFALLQKNVLDRQRWSSRDELRLAIVAWIEAKYHRTRRQRALGKFTPVEFESLYEMLNAA